MTAIARPATARQIAFILDLATERGVIVTDQEIADMDTREASQKIDELKALPRPVKAAPAVVTTDAPIADPVVADGRYAIENEAGEVRFYKVNTAEGGRWDGFTFVSVLASDEVHPVKGAARIAVLEKIAADPVKAYSDFGRLIGKCGVCNKTLTDADSREIGIGPKCRKKLGI